MQLVIQKADAIRSFRFSKKSSHLLLHPTWNCHDANNGCMHFHHRARTPMSCQQHSVQHRYSLAPRVASLQCWCVNSMNGIIKTKPRRKIRIYAVLLPAFCHPSRVSPLMRWTVGARSRSSFSTIWKLICTGSGNGRSWLVLEVDLYQ